MVRAEEEHAACQALRPRDPRVSRDLGLRSERRTCGIPRPLRRIARTGAARVRLRRKSGSTSTTGATGAEGGWYEIDYC
ncbi:hypothetical protein [Polyangium sp. 15x6]|uniref:hypothetical protein n=1 Tax=Polyangium sp. 15x6 TaxID=3042687 RepID=UPI00249C486F|nr:hypothetical protein [Polyangium sp. 15x6]MDI3283579.1 hypothetical protein [Polyangium sp. 15x6]